MNNFENEIEAYKKLLETFDWVQMEEIYAGIMSKIDVATYADPKFDGQQMEQIRYGLENDVDVSKYADPELNWREMKKIREKIEKGLGKVPELEI